LTAEVLDELSVTTTLLAFAAVLKFWWTWGARIQGRRHLDNANCVTRRRQLAMSTGERVDDILRPPSL
jgi:hypothetical protein